MKKNNKRQHHTTKETHLPTNTLKGILEVTNSGIGYVIMPEGVGDILVRQDNFNTAFHGDTVRVKVIKENFKSGKREGKITEVVQRKQTEFIGKLQLSNAFAFFIPDSNKPMPDFFIPKDKIKTATNNEKVIVRLVKWEKGDKKPVGEVMSILTSADENDAAMKEIIAAAGFALSFTDEVITETAQLHET
ncbi:MAG TPA: ribonuclease R, partial [Chitinophagaceae bacterium]|nr:ribonuclease R [Chitinophagaceae bacterium]